jgi:hypothetical protein
LTQELDLCGLAEDGWSSNIELVSIFHKNSGELVPLDKGNT